MKKNYVSRRSSDLDTDEIIKNIPKNINEQILIFKRNFEIEKNDGKKTSESVINEIIGEKIEVDPNTIYRYRSGDIKQPSLPIIIKLSRILNCSIDELVTAKRDNQEYLDKLEDKGFSPKAVEIIDRSLKARKYTTLFKTGVPNIRLDLFTILSHILENERFVNTLYLESRNIIEVLRNLKDYDTYFKNVEDINKVLDNENYKKFIAKLPKDEELKIENAKNNIDKMFEIYIKDYLFYIISQFYNEWNDNKDKI